MRELKECYVLQRRLYERTTRGASVYSNAQAGKWHSHQHGRRSRDIWSEVVERWRNSGYGPAFLIRTLFGPVALLASRLGRDVPGPDSMLGATFAASLEQQGAEEAKTLRLMLRAEMSRLVVFASAYYPSDKRVEALTKAVCKAARDTVLEVSPLFRVCVLRRAGDPHAEDFEVAAASQYLAVASAYDVAWADMLPAEFVQEVNALFSDKQRCDDETR